MAPFSKPRVSSRSAPIYNEVMAGSFFEDMKRHLAFDDRDVTSLRALADPLAPALGEVVEAFYDRLLQDPAARKVFTGGPEQMARVRASLANWLSELFSGTYNHGYCQNRLSIGRAHVRIGLPQHLMFTAMEIIWQELSRAVRAAGVPDPDGKLASLHKLLTLEIAMMLESFKESYALQIRHEERTVAEEKLTRSEHLAELGNLAASLAHEIKNPLAGISGAIQIIRDGLSPDDPHRGVIREIIGQINRLDAAVKDLLVYARPKPPEVRLCSLEAIITRVHRLMRDTPAYRGLHLVLECPRDVPPVPADDRQIEQLVMNLLDNAAHASEEGGVIETSLARTNGAVRLVIRDRGEGMDGHILERAFEPFFTTKARGTGLGLPICRKIVDAHGGTIALHSALNVGTEVVVELPQAPARMVPPSR